MIDNYFKFTGNYIQNIDETITILDCFESNITTIQNLPKDLKELMCDDTLIIKIENLPKNLEYFSCINTNIRKIENLPINLLFLDIKETDITKIENLPNYLIDITFSKESIKYIDNIDIKWFKTFNLKHYNTIKCIQRKIRKRLIIKNKMANIIQQGCENWIWKPTCKDNTIGINCRITKRQFNLK